LTFLTATSSLLVCDWQIHFHNRWP